MFSTDPGNVEPQPWRTDTITLDVERSKPHEENGLTADYYEILRVSPHADEDTIERVYRTLADRFHPDNPSTGNQETFLRLREAYEILSNKAERAKYNVARRDTSGVTQFRLRGREFFDGVRGGQNRRLAVLCLLYRQRIRSIDAPGLTILELEQLTGCTREEVTSALWYLCEKKWAMLGEFTTYNISAEGFDFVERKLEDRLEFRALATWSYYGFPAEAGIHEDTLPLDIEPALSQMAHSGPFGLCTAAEGSAFIADHYEILGIAPQADEEAIERVYQTLASRFHPDNVGTGDARTFARIREAYETLSDGDKRAQYDELRQRTRFSERFRLRGREFFEGIRGEQLRRLAVLCLLYRQAASELPGLTILDLEQLTGCTREELSSALWYLREKKWAKYGDFTEYSITAAGFDVVENKLDEREAARSREWLAAGNARGQGFLFPQVTAQPIVQNRQDVPFTARALIAGIAAPEDQNSHQIAANEPSDGKGEEPLSGVAEVAHGLIAIQESSRAAEQGPDLAMIPEIQDVHRVVEEEPTESGAKEPPNDVAEIAHGLIAIQDASRIAELSMEVAELAITPEGPIAPPYENREATEGTVPSEETFGIGERVSRLEALAEQFGLNQGDVAADVESPVVITTIAEGDACSQTTESAMQERQEAGPEQMEALADEVARTDASEPAVTMAPTTGESQPAVPDTPMPNTVVPEHVSAHWIVESDQAEVNQNRPLRSFVRRLLSFGAEPIAQSQLNLRYTLQPPPESAIIPEPQTPSSAISAQIGVEAAEPAVEEVPATVERVPKFENRGPEQPEPSNPWAWLIPEESQDNKPADVEVSATEAPDKSLEDVPARREVTIADAAAPSGNQKEDRLVEGETDLKREEPPEERPAAAPEPARIEEITGNAEQARDVPAAPEPPGVNGMNDAKQPAAEQPSGVAVSAGKRVILSMGGKGGVGKTSVMTGLAEWFEANQIPVSLLDLDTENKAKGSLTHFFGGSVPKINIHTPAGLDAFVDLLAEETPVILADMGAGAGKVTHDWFDKMYPDVADAGVVFTAVGVVTSDPASVESVLNWCEALQDRVSYVVVENCLSEHADFTYWQENDLAKEFRKRFQPAVVRLDYRLPDLENAARNYGVTLGQVASRKAAAPELQKASLVMRAQSYRRRMFAEFDKLKERLLP